MRTLLLLGTMSLLVAADTTDEQVLTETKKMAGVWVLESCGIDGKMTDAEQVKKCKISHSGNDYVLVMPHLAKEAIKGKQSLLNPGKTPKEMDFVRSNGPNAGKPLLAIYEFLGENKYRICYDPPGKERPRDFSTKAGSGHVLLVWKSAKD